MTVAPSRPHAALRARPAGLPESLHVDRCLVMGVLNVTPDSFSDGGRWMDAGAAVAHGLELVADGADLVDVGGESTRPGAQRVPEDEEHRRVLPVVRALTAQGVPVSVDTMRASTAAAALDAGACLVNDVSGGLADPELAKVARDARAPYVVMHWRGHSTSMQSRAVYDDVVGEVVAELRARVDAALDLGLLPEQLVVDPGLGFAKNAEHNWRLLAGLPALAALGLPVLVGASRKRFLGTLLSGDDQAPAPVAERSDATVAVTALAAAAGAWCVRVHEARANRAAVAVARAVQAAGKGRA
ncbi:dihydropteroate synthase [Motilibacter aurantiacus]|uniref:dihydropteroate synthase n=1 Tax=Motilibacter aurantiacus TaxID=2714955 RepID=UPI001E2C7548|nr:dihydropteroate synthase [Motilibacter aurantiacus]